MEMWTTQRVDTHFTVDDLVTTHQTIPIIDLSELPTSNPLHSAHYYFLSFFEKSLENTLQFACKSVPFRASPEHRCPSKLGHTKKISTHTGTPSLSSSGPIATPCLPEAGTGYHTSNRPITTFIALHLRSERPVCRHVLPATLRFAEPFYLFTADGQRRGYNRRYLVFKSLGDYAPKPPHNMILYKSNCAYCFI